MTEKVIWKLIGKIRLEKNFKGLVKKIDVKEPMHIV
jgi:hypothetical protein